MCAPLVFLLFLGTIASFSGAAEPPGGYYTTRYDHLDVENILNQKRLVHYYSECLLDRGPCTPQGVEFKRILPEALRTNCIRCTEKQLFVTVKSIKRLKKEYPEVWSQLAEIWDPTGDYLIKLEQKQANFKNHKEKENSVEATNVQENVLLTNRFGDDEPISVNTVAGKPVSFSTTSKIVATTAKPVIVTTAKPVIVTKTTKKMDLFTTKVMYNYDFAVAQRPVIFIPRPGVGTINLVIRDLITPITDIAGKVIVAGTDIAGMVLNALGIRPVIMTTASTT